MSDIPVRQIPTPTEETQPLWRDSSTELKNGLDVVELHVDGVLPLKPVPPKEATALERRSNRAGVRLGCDRGYWRASFEHQLSLFRPHLVGPVLAAMSHVAWTEDGTKDTDPVQAAKAWSAELDKKN